MTHTITLIAPHPRFEVGDVLTHAAAVQPPRIITLPRFQVVARCLWQESPGGLGSWVYKCRHHDAATGQFSEQWHEFCDTELTHLPTPEEEARFQQVASDRLEKVMREKLDKHLDHLDGRLREAVNTMKEKAS